MRNILKTLCIQLVLVPSLIYALHMSVDVINITATNHKVIKDSHTFVRPLMDMDGHRYCSSSSIKYGNEVYTLTNWHCCDGNVFSDGKLRVLDTLEKVLYMDTTHDICVLTSSQKDTTLELSDKEFEYLDPVTMMGFPRGDVLTPRHGYIISLDTDTSVGYSMGTRTLKSNISSAVIFPGNSGSPVFNSEGKVTNLAYAGPNPILQYSVFVPLRYIKEVMEKVSNGERLVNPSIIYDGEFSLDAKDKILN